MNMKKGVLIFITLFVTSLCFSEFTAYASYNITLSPEPSGEIQVDGDYVV